MNESALDAPDAAEDSINPTDSLSYVSRALLSAAQEMLVGGVPASAVRPGQVRLVVASLKAPFGPALAETDKVEVTLTVDGGHGELESLRH